MTYNTLSKHKLNLIGRRAAWALAVAITAGFLGACPHANTPPKPTTPSPDAWKSAAAGRPTTDDGSPTVAARRSTLIQPFPLPQVFVGTKIRLGSLPAGIRVTFHSTRIYRSSIVSPLADQMTGSAQTGADTGSYIVPLPYEDKVEQGNTYRIFTVTEAMPLFVKLEVASTAEPGEVPVPVQVKLPKGGPEKRDFTLMVSELVLPTEPRILAAATTTVDELSRLFPATFGSFNATYLDRGEPEHAAAVDQLDTLVKAAQREGMALYVEDLSPAVKVDDVGRVGVDWDAYDRVMSPYLDGSAFEDRVPLQVWLAPVPPRRIQETPTQLRQYMANCIDHFIAKGWVAVPAFLHPALIDADASPAVRDDVSKTLRMHLSKDVLAVTTPDATLPHPRLWVIDDSDTRLPPAGALGNAESVRVWPWVCAARGARGFVWRGAVARAGEEGANRPLFVADLETRKLKKGEKPTPAGAAAGEVVRVWPTLRMAWLDDGLNDAAMLGLLEKRGDPNVVAEVLAGVVGRTGLTVAQPAGSAGDIATPPTGFLYAGWPTQRRTWASLPALLEKLVISNDPGHRATVALQDPVYLQAKLWLAEAHRPVARVAGYTFNLSPGREGPVVDAGLELMLENPVDEAAQFQMKFNGLPGDFDVAMGGKEIAVPAYGLTRVTITAAGHLEAVHESPRVTPVEIMERNGGAAIRMPLMLPVYRMRELGNSGPPKIDGRGEDWAMDAQTRSFGPMAVGLRYLSRVDLLSGTAREEPKPASVRWTYDADYLYALMRCEQPATSDEKNNEWPVTDRRWWGTDGLQILICGGNTVTGQEIYRLGFKPGGVALVRVAKIDKPPETLPAKAPTKTPELKWTDGPTGLKYGMTMNRDGYTIEVAIPRKWFGAAAKTETDAVGIGARAGVPPQWRVNVLRHRAADYASSSWSGPIVDDLDLGMMGLLVGE